VTDTPIPAHPPALDGASGVGSSQKPRLRNNENGSFDHIMQETLKLLKERGFDK